MKVLGAVALSIAIVGMLWFGYRQWYVDTHCTMILGTQVCEQPAPPAPPPYTPCALRPGHPEWPQ